MQVNEDHLVRVVGNSHGETSYRFVQLFGCDFHLEKKRDKKRQLGI